MSQHQAADSGVYACEYSLQAGEQLFGTASRIDAWVLIEFPGAWGRKAFEESEIPEPVKRHLADSLSGTPNASIKLIRQPARREGDGLVCFVVHSDEADPRLYRFHLDSYDGLLALDPAAALAGDPAYQDALTGEKLILVCTNGRRDLCCARYGAAAYDTLAEQGGDAVWQSSHLGGHRFAANVACLPHGLIHGRIGEGRGQTFVETYFSNQVLLETLRGRSCYEPKAQVADYFLREQTGERGIDAYRLLDAAERADGVAVIRFSEPAAGQTHIVTVGPQPDPVQVFKSTGDEQTEPVRQYRRQAYEVS
jgi:hypothetical protein